jgi:hypothetical protein
LKNTTPTGLITSDVCEGSAVIDAISTDTAFQPEIIAVNNNNQPGTGATNTFEGSAAGATTLYVANLHNGYSGWNSALTIRKLNPGNTTVTVNYGGPWPNSTCNLTDAIPSCKLYMPTVHGSSTGRYGAKITSTNGNPILAVVGSTNGSLSNGVIGFTSGSTSVFAPNVQKYFYGYITAVTCVNVSTEPTKLRISYEGYAPNSYPTPATLNEGDSHQFLVFMEPFLPNGYQGGATVTVENSAARIACQVGNTRAVVPSNLPGGDWTVAYAAFGQ